MPDKRWIPETLFDALGLRMTYAIEWIRAERRTEHQQLVLFDHAHFGKVLMLDGAVQFTSRDQFVYHEMMSHVPIFAHGRARDVLIVGGGDCGVAREVLKHGSVEHLTQVEIDAAVVDFAKEHLPEFAGPVFADSRFDLVIADGRAYVAGTSRRFDVIMIDSTDPQGPGAALFTKGFYSAARRCLAPGGVLVTQNGVPFLQQDELVSTIGHLRGLFADAACYVAAVPSYVGGHLAFGWASDNARLRRTPAKTIAQRYRRSGAFATGYWTPEVHVAAFALPRFIAERLEQPGG